MEWIVVIECEYVEDYKLLLTFENGSIKLIDLKNELWGEAFESLKNIEYFESVKVNPDFDTICWENGADFASEFLYEKGVDIECKTTKNLIA
ncbi:MAG: DUF2442 domain-containing protein [Pegethrix bostrychoides GSE-TBD4-15B]|jgi:hypothetical protein|uniref:DUF2442 domain-containing protein n=1 Tax=Pegethrix bostrychoides GSE-TBD4-15B TaxID=2839662 RepID=A0A951PAH8_9CYAN|nr:DUF2442 domain-containing protein [Pegethrix bostrychoides GSE-TBD4-15B]